MKSDQARPKLFSSWDSTPAILLRQTCSGMYMVILQVLEHTCGPSLLYTNTVLPATSLPTPLQAYQPSAQQPR
jgi:hypothetical protein